MHYGGVPKITKYTTTNCNRRASPFVFASPHFLTGPGRVGPVQPARSRQHADDFNGKVHRPAAKAAAAAADTEPRESPRELN